MSRRKIIEQDVPAGVVNYQGVELEKIKVSLLENGASNVLLWVRNQDFDELTKYRVKLTRHGIDWKPGHYIVRLAFPEVVEKHILQHFRQFEGFLRSNGVRERIDRLNRR